MKLKFLSGFNKDLAQSNDKMLAKIVLQCIQLFEEAQNINQIPNIKKLKGHSAAYRYRKGKYRVGFYVDDNTIIFAAIAPRGKIYRKFP